MKWNDIQFTGLTSVDNVINLLIRCMFAFLAVIVIWKATKNYSQGNMPQFIAQFAIGIVLCACVIGFGNLIDLATSLSKQLPTGATTTPPAGGGK